MVGLQRENQYTSSFTVHDPIFFNATFLVNFEFDIHFMFRISGR